MQRTLPYLIDMASNTLLEHLKTLSLVACDTLDVEGKFRRHNQCHYAANWLDDNR